MLASRPWQKRLHVKPGPGAARAHRADDTHRLLCGHHVCGLVRTGQPAEEEARAEDYR